MGVIDNLRTMGVDYPDSGSNDAVAVLEAVYALDRKDMSCSHFNNEVLAPALNVPIIPSATMGKELVEYAMDNVNTLVLIEAEHYSGNTKLINPIEYQRLQILAVIGVVFIAFIGFKIIRKIIS